MGKNKISRRSFVKQLGLMGVAVSGIASVSAALPINSEDREKISLRKRSVPISKGWDVIVVGGGPSGCTFSCCSNSSKRRCENAFDRIYRNAGWHGYCRTDECMVSFYRR